MDIKRKAGRPKGSVSFVDVKFADLEKIAGPQMCIPISRIWWEKMGGVVENSVGPSAKASTGGTSAEDAKPIDVNWG
jgi:hypothetical protein